MTKLIAFNSFFWYTADFKRYCCIILVHSNENIMASKLHAFHKQNGDLKQR